MTTVLTLGVGIGATIAILSVVNGVLLKLLPFAVDDRRELAGFAELREARV